MKKSLFMLLCAACVALAGCKKESAVEEPETPQKPTADTTTYAVQCRLYSSTDDQKYLTFTYLFKNSTSDAYDTLRNVKEVSLDKDIDFMAMSSMKDSVNLLRVYAVDFRLAQGTYYLQIIRTRNTTPMEGDTLCLIRGNKLNSERFLTGDVLSFYHGDYPASSVQEYIDLYNQDKYKYTISIK